VSQVLTEYPQHKLEWRENPHPFYKLVALFLDDGVEQQPPSAPNPDFWGAKPPKEILIATGSMRKAIMLSVILNQVEFPFDHPMDCQDFLVKHIHNGNGSLRQKTFLGFYEGVPVYAQSAAAGETASNDPRQEAINKAQWLANQLPYIGDEKDYLVVTTDTVDFPDKNGNGRLDKGSEGLGKPMNDPRYPQSNTWMTVDNKLLRHVGERVRQWKIKNFNKNYIKENYQAGVELFHINSVALLEIMVKESPKLIETWYVVIRKLITEDFIENVKVYPDQGGGGATQQNQDWTSAESMLGTLDEETQGLLRSYFEEDPAFFKMLVLFQIAGMPAMNILKKIEEWAVARKQRAEAVVFDQQTQ
jgi:hypothetical protein